MTDIADAQNPLAGVLGADQIDAMVTAAEELGQGRHGVEELLTQMTKAVLERAMEAELSDHLGYEAGDPAGHGTGNSRNGKTTKSVQTLQGPVELTVPRDRNSSFEPVIVPKRARRLGKVEDMILSLYARGMTTRDIGSHLEEIYDSKVSAATISRVTDVVTDEISLWQSRPLETVYPIVYIDAIWLKIRDGGVVANKACWCVPGSTESEFVDSGGEHREEQMGRQGYSAEFSRKVLDLLAAGRSVAAVAHDLDLSDQTIYNWRRQDRIDRGEEPGLAGVPQFVGIRSSS